MKKKNYLRNIERRAFLKMLSLTGVGALIYPQRMITPISSQTAKSDIIVISNSKATNSTLQTVDENIVKSMIDLSQ
jgi:hypothetical protein